VKGRLDDPKFSVVPIIWQVVVNLLVKAAASPFALLGALVGGGEELSYIEFPPGQSAFGEVESGKIEKLAKALYERPALNLEITGSADDSLDRAALTWLKLEREFKSARMAELAGKSDAPASADEIRFEPREYARQLRASYKKAFDRERPLPAGATNPASGISPAATTRVEPRKGAEAQMAREPVKPVKATNALADANEPRILARPKSLPALPADDEILAQMELEMFARVSVTAEDFGELMRGRAQSVQRALLKTEKVTGERLFILAPQPAGATSKGQSRANLSLN
jgi:hypothetical protein